DGAAVAVLDVDVADGVGERLLVHREVLGPERVGDRLDAPHLVVVFRGVRHSRRVHRCRADRDTANGVSGNAPVRATLDQMELTELNHDERLALVALVTALIKANGRATDAESATVRRLAKAFGRPTYRQLAEEADERLSDDDRLRTALREVHRDEACELI